MAGQIQGRERDGVLLVNLKAERCTQRLTTIGVMELRRHLSSFRTANGSGDTASMRNTACTTLIEYSYTQKYINN